MSISIKKPTVDQKAPEAVQIRQIVDYLENLINDLNYHLNHLDDTNFVNKNNGGIIK